GAARDGPWPRRGRYRFGRRPRRRGWCPPPPRSEVALAPSTCSCALLVEQLGHLRGSILRRGRDVLLPAEDGLHHRVGGLLRLDGAEVRGDGDGCSAVDHLLGERCHERVGRGEGLLHRRGDAREVTGL